MKYKKVIIILVFIIILLILIFTYFVIRGGVLEESKYLEPWQKEYSDKFSDIRLKIISKGLLAANGHNMQPWKIKLDENINVFYLYVDNERLTKQVDPYARQTMITQGTFLEYVKIASKKLGYDVNFEFFPYGEYDELNLEESMKTRPVAKVMLNKTEYIDNELYDYMFLSDTNRGKYINEKLTQTQIDILKSANFENNITINIYQDENNLKNLGNYAIEGAKIESSIQRMNKESADVFRSNEYEKNKFRYGYSLEGQGVNGISKYLMQGLITVFPSFNSEKTSSNIYVNSTIDAVQNTPCYAMIITKSNSRIEQVKAGMVYSKLILLAHSQGLVMQPPSQVLEEFSEMSEQYSKIHSEYTTDGETIQMFFRVGKPTEQFAQSMRRDVLDLIIK